ncbi:MAG: S9 family peptidase [Bacteroidetes bacterium]|nr:S9 family peptidase [Bacteroidota bacterium]MBS1541623.1 S9 family peptidase [Bacteroidota bacterium]
MKNLLTLFLTVAASSLFAQGLEQFFSHPFESDFASSADGKHIAWVINDQGKRNVMLKTGNDLPRAITSYDQDDGQEIAHLLFSPNATKLIYVRGGSANQRGERPNPASLSEGVEQAIYFKDLSSKNNPSKITQGSNPLFYPDGLKILFSKGGQIYETNLDINAEPKLLFHARGTNHSPKFSPNNLEILFTSDRGDHSFTGIFSTVTKKIRWVSPDVSLDNFPVWSPDGKQIAFIRYDGIKIDELRNYVAGLKFSIWVADAESLTAKKIWSSPADDGGFAQDREKPLTWTSTNRILFYSEHTGWNHVFSMNPDGTDLKDITPGDNSEVENFTLDASGQNIYFDGNKDDIDRRHIWKSSVTAGNPVAVTSGEGIEMYPAFGGTQLYCYRTTINQPMALAKVDESRKIVVALNVTIKAPAYVPQLFVKPEQVIFKAADGTVIHGQLFIDRKISGKRPGLVYMHGGPERQMLLGFHYMDYYSGDYSFNQFLAHAGYAVVAVNYRDGIGYGKNFRQAKNQGPRGASEYQDVVAAAKFLQALPEVEASKIGLWGGSYGGYLTAMGLARNPEIFKAGVDLHGVHDWSFDAQDATNGWGLAKNEMELARNSSPVADLSKWVAPVLFIHGDDDRNVQFQQTTDLATKLRGKNVPVEVIVFPDEVHGFLRYETWQKVFNGAKDFFDRKLK